MNTGFFEGLKPAKFEGAYSNDPMAFHHYNSDEIILGKSMKEHLRFAVAYWHSFAWEGGDPFGGPTFERPWHPQDEMGRAKMKADVAFEMFDLLQNPFFVGMTQMCGLKVILWLKASRVWMKLQTISCQKWKTVMLAFYGEQLTCLVIVAGCPARRRIQILKSSPMLSQQ